MSRGLWHCATLNRLLVLCLAGMLSGCGFHPRGSITQLTDLGSIYVDAARNLSLTETVRDALKDAAFTLAPNRDEADILLRLVDEEESERVLSVTSNGRISELQLSHAINMLIAESADGQPPAYPPQPSYNRVEVLREYTYDETGVLGKENEARILREEMRQELVRQVVLRTIASLAPSVALLPVDDTRRNFAALPGHHAVYDLLYGFFHKAPGRNVRGHDNGRMGPEGVIG